MCCFSLRVDSVFDTNIFVRNSSGHLSDENRQYLVYSMGLTASEELAMILPLPVPSPVAEDAVRFINLEAYPDFFIDMFRGYPATRARFGGPTNYASTLEVVRVGSFDASFVPTIQDFDRLDPRFRMPHQVWGQLPQYQDYGFAVVKLRAGESKIHPIAFEFPKREPDRLFFPTIHIHDGVVHPMADFEHILYCQIGDRDVVTEYRWEESESVATDFMNIEQTAGIVAPNEPCYRLIMSGSYENRDLFL